ncbi:NUDIX domain-containing protein [Streptomyces sp. NPDC088766]
MEPGESLQETVMRELAEENGIQGRRQRPEQAAPLYR